MLENIFNDNVSAVIARLEAVGFRSSTDSLAQDAPERVEYEGRSWSKQAAYSKSVSGWDRFVLCLRMLFEKMAFSIGFQAASADEWDMMQQNWKLALEGKIIYVLYAKDEIAVEASPSNPIEEADEPEVQAPLSELTDEATCIAVDKTSAVRGQQGLIPAAMCLEEEVQPLEKCPPILGACLTAPAAMCLGELQVATQPTISALDMVRNAMALIDKQLAAKRAVQDEIAQAKALCSRTLQAKASQEKAHAPKAPPPPPPPPLPLAKKIEKPSKPAAGLNFDELIAQKSLLKGVKVEREVKPVENDSLTKTLQESFLAMRLPLPKSEEISYEGANDEEWDDSSSADHAIDASQSVIEVKKDPIAPIDDVVNSIIEEKEAQKSSRPHSLDESILINALQSRRLALEADD